MKFIPKFNKKQKLLLILLLIATLTIIGSAVADFLIAKRRASDAIEIALVAPLSGEYAPIGKKLQQSAQLFVDLLNADAKIGDRTIEIEFRDDENDPEKAAKIAREVATGEYVAVIGHWSEEVNEETLPIYTEAKMPVFLPNSTSISLIEDNEYAHAIVHDIEDETKFMANYVRNVLGKKGVSIVHSSTAYNTTIAETFRTTFEQFGTQIRNTWTIDSQEEVAAIAKEIGGTQAGTLFLAIPETEAALLIKELRINNIKNQIVGLSNYSSNYFLSLVNDLSTPQAQTAFLMDQVLITSSQLFDTAGYSIRNFASSYKERFNSTPDWILANVYIALDKIVSVLDENKITRYQEDKRERFNEILLKEPIEQAPIRAGFYNGVNIISALTQLEPINKGEVENYIDAVIQKRALLVNSKFMYKTNVAYTGVYINSIKDLDLEKGSVELDFFLWFRYSGDFTPEDIIFNNALTPIKLDKPLEEKLYKGLNYKSYHVKANFKINSIEGIRTYGTNILGLSFAHRELNTNNLSYVVDIVGMGLQGGSTFLSQLDSINAFSEPGWRLGQAWIGQKNIPQLNLGTPEYVRYNASDSEFSQIDFGILAVKSSLSIKDFVSDSYLIYALTLGIFGSIITMIMDYKDKGRFWRMQSWVMRVFFMPLTFLSFTNISLDYIAVSMPYAYVDIIVVVYATIWWILGAYLAQMLIERGLWMTLEEAVNRPVPNVIRGATSFVIYALCALGLLAFSFGFQVTSLLATSGLGVMVLGLAIQGNVANVISGIAINLERPFSIGDWIKIGHHDIGKVEDVTWRSIRLRTEYNNSLSIPNTEVATCEIRNYSYPDNKTWTYVDIDIPESKDPEMICEILTEAVTAAKIEGICEDEDSIYVSYYGATNKNFYWVDQYCVEFLMIWEYAEEFYIKAEVLKVVRERLLRDGISLGVPEKFSSPVLTNSKAET